MAGQTSGKTFKCSVHSGNVLNKFHEYYVNKIRTDITLIATIDNVKIDAHWLVVSASSEYFRAMFHTEMMDSRIKEVRLEHIDGATLMSILNFMYTSEIDLRRENVESVLRAAEYLQMNTLFAACCDFMGEHLHLGHPQSHKKSLESTLEKVYTEQVFLELDEEQLNTLLTTAGSRPNIQQMLFDSLVAWCRHNEEKREKFISSLLSKRMRFAYIVESNIKLHKFCGYSELMYDWLKWDLLPSESGDVQRKKLVFVQSLNFPKYIPIQLYNSDLKIWLFDNWPNPPEERSGCGMIVINKKLIIAGGFMNNTNRVDCLDLDTMTWSDLPPMDSALRFPEMVEIDGDLYVIDSSTFNNAIEKLDFSALKWQSLLPIPEAGQITAVAVLNGLLYVSCHKTCYLQCYNPTTNEWSRTAPRNREVERFGLAGLNGHLYAVGGLTAAKDVSKTVERYDPSSNTWTVIKSLTTGGDRIKCLAFNGRLIAYGGANYGRNCMNCVEEYNPEKNEWTNLPSPLNYLFEMHYLVAV